MRKANQEIDAFFRYILQKEEENRKYEPEMNFSNKEIANGMLCM